jgi:hypothetical protein
MRFFLARDNYLVDVLASELGNQGLNAVALGLNTDGSEEGSDVLGRGGGFTTDGEQKVGSEILHGLFFYGGPVKRKEL